MDKVILSSDYKKCKFPDDWNEYKLNELLKLVQRPIKMEDENYYELITVKRAFNGIVSRGRLKGKEIKVKTQFIVKKNDFIISKRQIAHGACDVIPKEFENFIVSNEYTILTNKEELYLDFLKWYVQLPFVRRYFFIMSDGVHVEKLLFKANDWLKRKICIPQVGEQQKIAKIISIWDNRIKFTQELIKEKKLQKKELMQRLLTGNKRLKKFENKKWKEVKLGEILKERKETGYEYLELLAITSKNGVVRRNTIDIKDNSSKDKSRYKRILPMDIGYNTMRMWQGVCGVSKYEGIVSPAYTILKPTKKVDSIFIGYLFKLPVVIDKLKRYSQGLVNDTLNLKYQNFKVIKCTIPTSIEEQSAIANILITADKEINLLEQKLEILKEQKKGIMQNLLTGKVRVKI